MSLRERRGTVSKDTRRLTIAACLAVIALCGFATLPAWASPERGPSELPYTVDVSFAGIGDAPGSYVARVEFRRRGTGELATAVVLRVDPDAVTESQSPPFSPLVARVRIELSADGTASYSAELKEEGIALVAAKTGTVSLPNP
jgi:hypothetical protein